MGVLAGARCSPAGAAALLVAALAFMWLGARAPDRTGTTSLLIALALAGGAPGAGRPPRGAGAPGGRGPPGDRTRVARGGGPPPRGPPRRARGGGGGGS